MDAGCFALLQEAVEMLLLLLLQLLLYSNNLAQSALF